jgi:hypothetical protein
MHHPAFIAERRKWDRLSISIPLFVRGRESWGKEFLEFATVLNVSGGGVLLATRSYIEPGTHLLLEIPLPLVNKAQLPSSVSRLQATVRRCTPTRHYFLLGLQFEEPLISTGWSRVQEAGRNGK